MSKPQSPLSPKPLSDLSQLGERTRLVHAGRDPSEQHGFVNTPIYRGSTVLFPTTETSCSVEARYTYGTKGTPTTEVPRGRLDGDFRRCRDGSRRPPGSPPSRSALMSCLKAGDHLLMTDSVYRADADILRRRAQTLRGGNDLLRPACRRRHRGALAAEYRRRLYGGARLPILRDAGRAGDRRGGPPARSRGPHGQYLGDAPSFPPHERGVDIAIEAGTKYLSGGSDLLLGMVSANERCFQTYARPMTPSPCARVRRTFFSDFGACGRWHCACASTRSQALAMARWLGEPSGGRPGAPPGDRERSRSRHLEAGFQGVLRAVLGRS